MINLGRISPKNGRLTILFSLLISAAFIFFCFVMLTGQYARKEDLTGVITMKNIVRLPAGQAGHLVHIAIAPGDFVQRDQVLFTVRPLAGDLQTQSSLTSAEQVSRYQQLLSSSQQDYAAEQLNEQQQQKLIAQQRKSLQSKLREIASARQSIEKRLALAKSQLDSYHQLNKIGVVKSFELQEGQGRYQLISAELNTNKSEQLATEQQILQLQQSVSDIKNNLNRRKSELLSFQEDVQNKLDSAQMSREYSITAPMDGIIDTLPLYQGMLVDANTTVVLLRSAESANQPSADSQVVSLSVTPTAIGFIKAGDEVLVRVDAFPYERYGVLKARINQVTGSTLAAMPYESEAERQKRPLSYLVEAEITGQRGNLPLARLKDGMTVSSSVSLQKLSLFEWLFLPINRAIKRNPDF